MYSLSIKYKYYKYLTNIETECEYILWLRIDKSNI